MSHMYTVALTSTTVMFAFKPICYRAFAVYGYFLTRIRTRRQAENIKRRCELQLGCKATVRYGYTDEHREHSTVIYILTAKYLFQTNQINNRLLLNAQFSCLLTKKTRRRNFVLVERKTFFSISFSSWSMKVL